VEQKKTVVISVVVLEESPCPRGSSGINFQVLALVLVLESQALDNNTGCNAYVDMEPAGHPDCNNHGRCNPNRKRTWGSCQCLAGWTGPNCQWAYWRGGDRCPTTSLSSRYKDL